MGRPGGRRGLINGSCFRPNTQLADLTKCSVSSPPLFFLARCNVCPQRTGGGEGESSAGVIKVREVVPEHILYHQLLSSIKCNEMRLGEAEFIFFVFFIFYNLGLIIRVLAPILFSPT